MVSESISEGEKRQALERVIASKTFGRSDQLRSFLRYICEAEFEGRAHEINEYVLGVSVLGRPANYSPTEDSCVRSRAYELRNKLKSYYQLEAPDDPVQIEIRKGAYVPQFQRTNGAAAEPVPERVEPPPAVIPPVPAKRFAFRPAIAVLALAAIAVPVLYYAVAGRDRNLKRAADPQPWTPEMTAFWKPFLNTSTPLIVSFEIRLFFFSKASGLVVRDYQTNQLADLPASKTLSAFRARMEPGELQQTDDYTDLGAVHAAFLLGRLLGPQHAAMGLKHSGSLGWEDLWNSNVIFLGKPNLNPTVRYALKSADFAEDDLGVIRNLHPKPGEAEIYRSANTHGSGVKYALITLTPGPQSGHHVMILSGAGSEFLWALAQCVTDPARVKELVTHLRQPSGDLPDAFQVLIQVSFESNVPIQIRYVTHRVSKPA
jgi:hypothetical protein